MVLPGGKTVRIAVKPCDEERSAWQFQVQKDAGDDPDVTHGAWVCAGVQELDDQGLEEQRQRGQGYWLETYPNLYLAGGTGVGMATRPGLSCPVGHAAINPVPRRMILEAVDQVCRRAAFDGKLLVEVAIPEGVLLAEKTFNPRLGIEGGISILGTTGIVKPMSEEALLATIRLDIHMQAVNGGGILLMAPGNYGEAFLQEEWQIPLGKAVLCSNFVGEAVEMIGGEGLQAVLFVGHIGKLIKVAAGRTNTHSKYGDGRMEELAGITEQICREASGADSGQKAAGYQVVGQVRACNTTEEALSLLKEAGLDKKVLQYVAQKVRRQMLRWSGGTLDIQVVVFSSAQKEIGETDGARRLLERWRKTVRWD